MRKAAFVLGIIVAFASANTYRTAGATEGTIVLVLGLAIATLASAFRRYHPPFGPQKDSHFGPCEIVLHSS